MAKAAEIYERAKRNGIELECTCVGIRQSDWDKLMEGATRANKRVVDKLVRDNTNGEFATFLDFWNPYDHFKTETHIIFVHSGIEHFFRIK